jgi:hypothetical protein
LDFLQNLVDSFLAAERQFHRADWTRGEVIRRLTSEQTFFGLLRFSPGLGKVY